MKRAERDAIIRASEEELEAIKAQGYKFHHSARHLGYIAPRGRYAIWAYKGRFGEGYCAAYSSAASNRFCTVEYYIKPKR